MRGALLLSAARTPYRRAGLSFPIGAPLTVAIVSLGAAQLRQLLEDPAVTVMVGQDNGPFVVLPELTATVSDADLQAFIDAAPSVDIDAQPVPPVDPTEDVAALRQLLAERSAALVTAHDQLADAQKALRETIDPAELERLRGVDAAWHVDQRHLHDQGFQSLDALTSAWAADRAALLAVQEAEETPPSAKAADAKPAKPKPAE